MAVNISPFHFHEKDFPKFVRNCLEALKLDPEYLDLEITEGVIMNQTEEIIRLGHSFDLNVISEGVETEDQLQKLATMRCDQAQGFYIKRPDTADEITKWIKSNNA